MLCSLPHLALESKKPSLEGTRVLSVTSEWGDGVQGHQPGVVLALTGYHWVLRGRLPKIMKCE